MFDNALIERVPADILTIPGVYEIVSEYYNDEILDELWEAEHRDNSEEDE